MVTTVKDLHGTVGIFFNSVLGSGTYGKVCKAKCGLLPCAAKVFHDSLFPLEDSNSKEKVIKLEKECKDLSLIRHPNLVQYLGIAIDPKTKRPLLFMEILDKDLTQFLGTSSEPLPYFMQLKISYEVALGLGFLHFNSLVHGSLSSNNVLLIGEANRAKLTDFGLYKFTDTENLAIESNRMLPYMAAETLLQPPVYSSKADCFSYGVILLQILTRKFPEPTKETSIVDGNVVRVIEIERRKSDINQVNPGHQLLSTMLDCLKDSDIERLSADKICDRIALLKRKTLYQNSRDLHITSLERLQRSLQRKEKLLKKCNAQIDAMKEQHEKELQMLRMRKENDIRRAQKEVTGETQSEEKREDGEEGKAEMTDNVREQDEKESSTPPEDLPMESKTSHVSDDEKSIPAQDPAVSTPAIEAETETKVRNWVAVCMYVHTVESLQIKADDELVRNFTEHVIMHGFLLCKTHDIV